MDNKIISFRSPSHILAGMGAIDQLKEEVNIFNAKRALLVTDKGILEFGLDQKVREQLQDAGIEVDTFDQVISDPDIACANACTEMAKAGNHELIIGLGGGSPMDIASAAAVMCTNPGSIHDYLGIGLVKNPARQIKIRSDRLNGCHQPIILPL